MQIDVNIRDNAEQREQNKFCAFLHLRGWITMRTHGNSQQKGFPDIYALHHSYGAKWIEFKKLPKATITKAQLTVFTEISKAGHGIWIITETSENEYAKLHRKPNWTSYLSHPDVYVRGIDPTALLQLCSGTGPEADIQNAFMQRLRSNGWICLPTTGNLYQHGFPDIYVLHREHGAKWVEVKRVPSFTPAQRQFFPIIANAGHQIWIVTSELDEYKLYQPPNWTMAMFGGML